MKKFITKKLLYSDFSKITLKMKLTTLLLIVSLFKIQANTYAQDTKISLDLKNTTIETILKNIESQSEFIFFYEASTIDLSKKTSLTVKKQKISKILNQLFSNTPIIYNVVNKHIMLKNEQNNNKLPQTPIKGAVVDEDNIPLAGVTIVVKGTSIGALTDFDGAYTINAKKGDVLSFSFVGLKSETRTVGDETTINITMVEDVSGLDEVVITALGIKRQKRDLGYATQGVTGKSLVRASSPDVITALSGQIAGVNISVPDGVEGSSSRIVIRGNNSITGNNQPLIIIDGVPQSDDFIERENFNGYTDWGTALNNINAFDIETMDVLKGPAAAALYGARGSNGVVLITTKKGKKQKGLGINYSSRFRITKATRYRDVQNVFGSGGPILANDGEPALPTNGDGELTLPGVWGTSTPQHSGSGGLGGRSTWADFSWYASSMSWGPRMDGQLVRWWDGELRPFSPQPDNIKAFFETGTNQEHNVSLSTAGEIGSIRLSLTNLDHESVIPNSNYEQTTVNLGGSLNISDKITANIALTYFEYSRLNSPILGDADNSFGKASLYYYPRNYKVLDKEIYENPDGSRNPLNGYGNVYWGNSQYLWWNVYNNNTTLGRNKMLGSLSINYDVTDWFEIN